METIRLVFVCNYLNHHQMPVADALYDRLGERFGYVLTREPNADYMQGGMDYSDRPYCVAAWCSIQEREKAERLMMQADAVVFGAESHKYAVWYAKHKPEGIAFEMGERWLKQGWKNLLSPVLLRWLKNYLLYYRHRPFYKLNCSGFAARDHQRLHTYGGRCYRWGYFTQVRPRLDRKEVSTDRIALLWVGRMIDWKHPELAIYLAKRLKMAGVSFSLTMIGQGPENGRITQLSHDLGVEEQIIRIEHLSNTEVLNLMKQSDLLLMTSDGREGWGAVLNEAMGMGCAVVASDAIGAVPYLINDGVNGSTFASGDLDMLECKVMDLIEHPDKRQVMGQKAYETITGPWSPKQAAGNLLHLVNDLRNHRTPAIKTGPASLEA